MMKAEKGDLLHGCGHVMGRGRVSTQLIFSHLQGIDMSYKFKYTKELEIGDKGMHSYTGVFWFTIVSVQRF
jgi:hypothetical protein